jgi:hypothetical protein
MAASATSLRPAPGAVPAKPKSSTTTTQPASIRLVICADLSPDTKKKISHKEAQKAQKNLELLVPFCG